MKLGGVCMHIALNTLSNSLILFLADGLDLIDEIIMDNGVLWSK